MGRIEAQGQQTKAQVGYLLAEIQEKESWKGHYENFHQFILSLEDLYKQSYSSLYSYFSTARELKGVVTPEEFEQIGIGKAQELAKTHKKGSLPSEIIQEALSPETTVKSLQERLVSAQTPLNERPEQGTYVDISIRGYVTEEEKLVLTSAREAAWSADPITPLEWSEGKRNLSAQLKLSMEFLGAHQPMEEDLPF